MATQPPYGWRVPLDTDRPAGARQMRDLAEDIAATVGTTTARSHAETKRTDDTSYASNTYGAVSGPVSITTAPPGVYDITWVALWGKAEGSGSPVQIRVLVNGAASLEGTITETADTYRRIASGSVRHVQSASGVLNVAVEMRGQLAPVNVYTGSRIDVTRVSI